MKSRKALFGALLLAGLFASALALRAQAGGGECCGNKTECCDKICAPLCCPGH